jgi:tRNA(Arg) A34 adenosine deaminase TadA
MKSSCPICKATLKKKGKDKVIFFSTNDASSSETGPPDQRVVEENEGLKTRVKKLNESVTEKEREILQLREKQIQQNTTLQYLKQLKRQVASLRLFMGLFF